MSEIKPCPFCGPSDAPTAELHSVSHPFDEDLCWVQCCLCNRTSVTCANDEDGQREAIEEWNTRPIEDALRARVAELEEAIKTAADLLVAGEPPEGRQFMAWSTLDGRINPGRLRGTEEW